MDRQNQKTTRREVEGKGKSKRVSKENPIKNRNLKRAGRKTTKKVTPSKLIVKKQDKIKSTDSSSKLSELKKNNIDKKPNTNEFGKQKEVKKPKVKEGVITSVGQKVKVTGDISTVDGTLDKDEIVRVEASGMGFKDLRVVDDMGRIWFVNLSEVTTQL